MHGSLADRNFIKLRTSSLTDYLLPTIFVFDFSPSLPLPRVIRETRKRESDTIPRITVSKIEDGAGSRTQDDEVLEPRNEVIFHVRERPQNFRQINGLRKKIKQHLIYGCTTRISDYRESYFICISIQWYNSRYVTLNIIFFNICLNWQI